MFRVGLFFTYVTFFRATFFVFGVVFCHETALEIMLLAWRTLPQCGVYLGTGQGTSEGCFPSLALMTTYLAAVFSALLTKKDLSPHILS